jgi:hypothetical protein
LPIDRSSKPLQRLGPYSPGDSRHFRIIGLPGDFDVSAPGHSSTGTAPATLTAGDWKYATITGSLTVTGNVRLQLTNNTNSITLGNNTSIIIQSGGSLTIYAQGGINADSNNVNLNNANNPQAKNFIYYMYGTSTSAITIKNSSNMYISIYAPNSSSITFKNGGNFYGSVIGKTVTFMNNSNIHYDEDLYNYGAGGLGSGSNFQIRSWEEMTN